MFCNFDSRKLFSLKFDVLFQFGYISSVLPKFHSHIHSVRSDNKYVRSDNKFGFYTLKNYICKLFLKWILYKVNSIANPKKRYMHTKQ